MRRFTLFIGWVIVVGLATTLTWQIVSAADDRVSERPIAPLNVAAPVLTQVDTTTTTTLDVSTTTSIPATTSTSSTGTTANSSAPTSSSTTPPAPPTTAAAWQTRSVKTAGGTVNLRYRPGEVAYQSATPAPGFQVEVEKPGPPEVRVEFESESSKVEVEATWQDDGLDVHVSSEDEGED